MPKYKVTGSLAGKTKSFTVEAVDEVSAFGIVKERHEGFELISAALIQEEQNPEPSKEIEPVRSVFKGASAKPRLSGKLLTIVACVCIAPVVLTIGACVVFSLVAAMDPIDAADKPYVEHAEEIVKLQFDAPSQLEFDRKTYKITRKDFLDPFFREEYSGIEIYGEGLYGDEPFSFETRHRIETGKLEAWVVKGKSAKSRY